MIQFISEQTHVSLICIIRLGHRLGLFALPHPVGGSALLISAYVIWAARARGSGRWRQGCVRVITLHHLSTPLFFHFSSPLGFSLLSLLCQCITSC